MKIGELESEKHAKENEASRQIVREILNFGVNDRMILMIIHSLALNLESVENMQTLTETVRCLNSDTFLIDRSEDSGEMI